MLICEITEEDIRIVKEHALFEDDYCFFSQMFEKNWTPRDTVVPGN
jgi:hypothetical protein